jgi:hypothetical protein
MMMIAAEQIVAAYALTSDEIAKLGDLLSTVYLEAEHVAYRQAQGTVKPYVTLSHPWEPQPGDIAQAHAWGAAQAASIANTYREMLTRVIEQLTSSSISAASEGIGDLAQSIKGLVLAIKAWLHKMLAWKIPQIVTNVVGIGSNAGTERIIHDILVELNTLASTMLTHLDGTAAAAASQNGLLAKLLAHIRVRVSPADSSDDLCRKWAGKTYSLSEATSLPSFPMHPSCIHYKEVIVV